MLESTRNQHLRDYPQVALTDVTIEPGHVRC
jgi:hypothetical protein